MLTNLPVLYDFRVGVPNSRRFQPGEGPSRGLLRDCENRLWNRWIVLQHYRGGVTRVNTDCRAADIAIPLETLLTLARWLVVGHHTPRVCHT